MAVDFNDNNTSAYYTAADDAGLSLPNGQFAIVWWARMDDNAGDAFQYAISTNTYGANNSLNIFTQEDDFGDADDGAWNALIVDGSGNSPGQLISAGHAFADGVDRMYVFQRTASLFELWSCVRGSGDATVEVSASIGSTGASNGGTWNIGRRSDGNSARYFEEHLGEIAYLSSASLSETDIEALADGTETILEAGYSPEAYWSLNDADDVTDDSGTGHSLTKNGSPANSGFQFIDAAGGLSIPVAAQHYRNLRVA